MKNIYLCLILASILSASPVFAEKAVDLQDFEQVKQMMLPVMTKSIAPLEQTRDCVVDSTNSNQLNACVDIMAAFQSELAQNHGGVKEAPKMPPLEWSRAVAEQIRSDLDKSLRGTKASIECLRSSSSHEAMDKCMRDAGVGTN